MEIFIIFLIPLLSSGIFLILEYLVILPLAKNHQKIHFINSSSLKNVYHVITLILVSAISGFSSSLITRFIANYLCLQVSSGILHLAAEIISNSNLIFVLISIFSSISGAVLSYFILFEISDSSGYFDRIIVAIIIGIIGGFLFWIIWLIGIVVLFFIILAKISKQAQSTNP